MSFPTTATLRRMLGQYGVPYLARDDWGHTAKLGPSMPGYARGIHVHHTVTFADDDHNFLATEDVKADMREIERISVSRFGRFSYSFAIHPSGVVGEGAGFTVGAHTANYNSSTFGIVFIGNMDRDTLTRPMIGAFKALVTVLRVSDAATGDCYIKPHRDRKATACPGQHVIDNWVDLINLSSALVPIPPIPDPEDDMTPDQAKLLSDIARRVGVDNDGADLSDELDLLRKDSRAIGTGLNTLLKAAGLPEITTQS